MSLPSALRKALELLASKGSEKELQQLAKKLSAEELASLQSAFKGRFNKDVYHATPAKEGFDAFDLNRGMTEHGKPIGASFVTPDLQFAEHFVPGGGKVMKLKANTSNIFDYENPEHLKALYEEAKKNPNLIKIAKDINDGEDIIVNGKKLNPFMYLVRRGEWELLEHPEVQSIIKKMGFDGFNVAESGTKNYAFFDPNVDLRKVDAEFNPLKKDTGNLTSGIALAAGAGLAGSAMMPEEAEAAPIYKWSEVAKAVAPLLKKGEINKEDIMKTLGWSAQPKSKYDIEEQFLSAKSLLHFAIMDKLGLPLSSTPGLYTDKFIKRFHPWLTGREEDTIKGLYDKKEGLELGIRSLMEDYGMSREAATNYINKNSIAGFYSPGKSQQVQSLDNFNSDEVVNTPIPARHKIYLFEESGGPTLIDHEIQHLLDSTRDPRGAAILNRSNNFAHPKKSLAFTEDPDETIHRSLRLLPLEKFDEFLDLAKDFQTSPWRPKLNPKEKRQFRKIVSSFIPKEKQLDFNTANHFLDYDNFELERALQILNDRTLMPSRSPIEGDYMRRLMIDKPNDIQANTHFLEKLSTDMRPIEVPTSRLDAIKQTYNNPRFEKAGGPKTSTSHFLSNEEKMRLRELEEKFGDMDIDDL